MTTMLDRPPIQPTTYQESEPHSTVARKRSLFDPEITIPAIWESFKKLNPVHMVKNPVMFVTEVGAAVTTVEIFFAKAHGEPFGFVLQIAIWLWFTVLFANFGGDGGGTRQGSSRRPAQDPHQDQRTQN